MLGRIVNVAVVACALAAGCGGNALQEGSPSAASEGYSLPVTSSGLEVESLVVKVYTVNYWSAYLTVPPLPTNPEPGRSTAYWGGIADPNHDFVVQPVLIYVDGQPGWVAFPAACCSPRNDSGTQISVSPGDVLYMEAKLVALSTGQLTCPGHKMPSTGDFWTWQVTVSDTTTGRSSTMTESLDPCSGENVPLIEAIGADLEVDSSDECQDPRNVSFYDEQVSVAASRSKALVHSFIVNFSWHFTSYTAAGGSCVPGASLSGSPVGSSITLF